jgi:hypothetical protein
VEHLAGEAYESFAKKLRVELTRPGTPLRYRNQVWSVVDRKREWLESSKLLFDVHLDRMKQEAAVVFTSSASPVGDIGEGEDE